MNIKIECAHDKIVALDKLKPHPANPNKHPEQQIALLAKIIKAQGWRNPIVVSKRSGLITKGHARLEAAKLIGTDTAPVDYQDYANEKEELADMIADNRIAELAEPDRTMLRELAEQLDDGAFDMDLTGFDHDALEELMTAAPPENGVDAEPQIDKADELRQKWGVKRGQIWQLGEHRLMCGDSISEADVSALMDGAKVRMTWTDPPYGVNCGAKLLAANPMGYRVRSIKNDDLPAAKLENFIRSALSWAAYNSVKGGSVYAACPPGTPLPALIASFAGSGFEFRWGLVWVKDQLVLGRGDYHFRHENILYGWKTDAAHYFIKERTHDSIFEIPRPKRSEEHPTMKPTLLVATMIRNSSKISEGVYDPFVGSGTTIIACEQLGRKCRAMEIDPGYVAVSIQRWADATGKIPQLLK